MTFDNFENRNFETRCMHTYRPTRIHANHSNNIRKIITHCLYFYTLKHTHVPETAKTGFRGSTNAPNCTAYITMKPVLGH